MTNKIDSMIITRNDIAHSWIITGSIEERFKHYWHNKAQYADEFKMMYELIELEKKKESVLKRLERRKMDLPVGYEDRIHKKYMQKGMEVIYRSWKAMEMQAFQPTA